MTDLQTSLIVIGSTIVVGVISYNKWQEYKAKKSVQRAFSTPNDDVLMKSGAASVLDGKERHEPSFTPSHPATSPATPEASLSGAYGEESEVVVHGVPKELPVDALIDCIIPLALDGPVRGEKLIMPLQSLRHVGNKPVHFIGQRDDGEWESIVHGGSYSAIHAGVQMANRSTALNELEYSELVTRLRLIADDLGVEADFPDMKEVMQSARSLHQFVVEFDARLSVNIQSNGAPWAINTLLGALERQGFDLRPDGRLVMPDGDGGILFTMSTNVTLAADTTARLTLLLDVPCVAPARDGFGNMVACAKGLAARLDGTVVDDSNQALSEDAIGAISEQVYAFYQDMETVDISAGSSRALRLFS